MDDDSSDDSRTPSRDGRLCETTMDGRAYPSCPVHHVVFRKSHHYIHAWRCGRHRGTSQACEPTRWSEKRRLEFDVDRTPCPACVGRTVKTETRDGVKEVVRDRSGRRRKKKRRKRVRVRTPSPEPQVGCCIVQ